MEELKKDHEGPCLNKGCSWCCDPVKIPYNKHHPLSGSPPTDKKGEVIFEETNEELIPEEHIETVRIKTYQCKNFNKSTGLCEDYEHRPDICRNTSCIDPHSKETVDEQHKKITETKFIKIENPRRMR